MNKRLPLQPVYITEYGQPRFRENRIVRFLLEAGPFDMNKLAAMRAAGAFSREEEEQFASLIGYSVGGFGDLSYVSDEAYNEAKAAAQVARAAVRKGTT